MLSRILPCETRIATREFVAGVILLVFGNGGITLNWISLLVEPLKFETKYV